ncbi:hypothetical protein MRX96_020683 [Rhipicephalus microplus]
MTQHSRCWTRRWCTHRPATLCGRQSVWTERLFPGPPDLTVMPSAVVCEPLVGVSGEEIWRTTGARPKEGRNIPHGRLADTKGPKRIALSSSANLTASTPLRPSVAENEHDPHLVTAPTEEVTHTPLSLDLGYTVDRDQTAPSASPVPAVRTAVVVRGPTDSNSQGSIWRGSGVRLRGRQRLPSGLLSDTSDSEEDPAFCRGSSSFSPPSGEIRNTAPAPTAPFQPLEGSSIVEDSEPKCPECGRLFGSKSGLSQHRRHAHIEAYNADIDVERSKPRWTREEEYLMAIYEVQLLQGKVYNINQRMAKKFPSRTFDGIKSHRRMARYQALVKELLAKSGATGDHGDDGADPLVEDSQPHSDAVQPIDPRTAMAEEL